jgi:hypothetical protein
MLTIRLGGIMGRRYRCHGGVAARAVSST